MMNSGRSRARRYAMIFGLLAIAALLAISVYGIKTYFPHWFDQEIINAQEIEKLQSAELQANQELPIDQWPQFRGAFRDGRANPSRFRTNWKDSPPTEVWRTSCGGGYSSFAYMSGRLYTQDRIGDKERILCLNADDGSIGWEISIPMDYSAMTTGYAEGPRATPTIHDGMLYAVGATGMLTCLQLPKPGEAEPEIRWQKNLIEEFDAKLPTWGFACSPLVQGDQLIVQAGGRKGTLVSLNRFNGDTRWTYGRDPNGYSSPIIAEIAGKKMIVAVSGTTLFATSLDGQLLWEQPWATQFQCNISMPVIAGDYVFISSNYSKGCGTFHITALGEDRFQATPVYVFPNKVMRTHHSTCILHDGYLFGFDNNRLACVSMRNGVVQEDWPSPQAETRFGKGALVLVGNNLLGLSERGTLFLANTNPEEFELLGQIDNILEGSQCWALPIVIDGRIYLRDNEKVLCIDSRIPAE